MPSLIGLYPETFSRLVEEARRRHVNVDYTADRILHETLSVIHDANSTLATLGRLAQVAGSGEARQRSSPDRP